MFFFYLFRFKRWGEILFTITKAIKEMSKESDRIWDVSRLICGCAALAGLYSAAPYELGQDALHEAIASGITWFDMAPWYGAGLAERLTGEGLRTAIECRQPSTLRLSTKVGRIIQRTVECEANDPRVAFNIGHWFKGTDGTLDPAFVPVHDYTYQGVMESYRQSIERMGLTPATAGVLDTLFLHDCETEERYAVATQDRSGVEALIELKRQGKVKKIGLGMSISSFALRFLHKYKGFLDSVMLAGQWNLMDTTGQCVLEECKSQGVEVINVGIFGGGLLFGQVAKYQYEDPSPEVMQRLGKWQDFAQRAHIALPSLALGFAVRCPVVKYIAIGMSTPDHVKRNVAMLEQPVPPDSVWHRAAAEGLLSADTLSLLLS